MDTNPKPIAILGAGSWGTALALYLSRLGQVVRLWSHDSSHVAAMVTDRVNGRYLPDYSFPDCLEPIADLANAVSGMRDIVIAVPSHAFHDLLLQLKPFLSDSTRILWITKGLDPKTGQLLHEVAREVAGKHRSYAALSGPSFASEVAAGLPTAVVIASQDKAFAHDLVERFNSAVFRVYSSHDMAGVEVGGIVKNILAIATGISDGMSFGANARSALITRGLAEMVRLGNALGGRHETFMGLAGIGDLVLTCTDNQSRNRRFGLALGTGQSAAEAERQIGQVVEGRRNAELVVKLAQKYHVEMPITEMVWEILRGNLTPEAAMRLLLSRETKAED
ncbi:MAG: NAD(P)H-dependent glycerol-3-phosphate dehydrogenase [Gammaproteobacteria bacterium]